MASGSIIVISLPAVIGIIIMSRGYRKGQVSSKLFFSVLAAVFVLILLGFFFLSV